MHAFRCSRHRYARRIAFGMVLDGEGPAGFGSPDGRRKLALAHTMLYTSALVEMERAQQQHERQPPARRHFITAFASPSAPRFQSFYKHAPELFCVEERRVAQHGDIASVASNFAWCTGHDATTSSGNAAARDVSRPAAADTAAAAAVSLNDAIAATRRAVTDVGRTAGAGMQLALHRHLPRRRASHHTNNDDDGGSSLSHLTRIGEWVEHAASAVGGAAVSAPSTSSIVWRMPAEDAQRLQRAMRQLQTSFAASSYASASKRSSRTMRVSHQTSPQMERAIAEAVGRCVALAAQQDATLAAVFPAHVVWPRVRPVEGRASWGDERRAPLQKKTKSRHQQRWSRHNAHAAVAERHGTKRSSDEGSDGDAMRSMVFVASTTTDGLESDGVSPAAGGSGLGMRPLTEALSAACVAELWRFLLDCAFADLLLLLFKQAAAAEGTPNIEQLHTTGRPSSNPSHPHGMDVAAEEEEELSIAGNGGGGIPIDEPMALRLPWVKERRAHVSHLTGAILRGPRSAKERGYGRADERVASAAMMQAAMEALNVHPSDTSASHAAAAAAAAGDANDAMLGSAHERGRRTSSSGGADPTLKRQLQVIPHRRHLLLVSPRVVVSGDFDFLYLSWRPPTAGVGGTGMGHLPSLTFVERQRLPLLPQPPLQRLLAPHAAEAAGAAAAAEAEADTQPPSSVQHDATSTEHKPPALSKARSTTPPLRSPDALQLPAAPASAVAVVPPPLVLRVPFTVIEFVLEKRGLPHAFVADDLQHELSCRMQQTLLRDRHFYTAQQEQDEVPDGGGGGKSLSFASLPAAALLPTVVVTAHTQLDGLGWSRQFVRVRGADLAHILALQRDLATGSYFTSASFASSSAAFMPSGRHHPNAPFAASHMTFHRARSPDAWANARHTTQPGWQRASSSQHVHAASRGPQRITLNIEEHEVEQRQDAAALWADRWYKILQPTLLFDESLDMAAQAANHAEEEGPAHAKARRSFRSRMAQQQQLEARMAQFDLRSAHGIAYDCRVTLGHVPLPLVASGRVAAAIATTALHGFLNYFAPSRFSNFTRNGQHVGLHLLRGEYQAAAAILVLQDRSSARNRRQLASANDRRGVRGDDGVRWDAPDDDLLEDDSAGGASRSPWRSRSRRNGSEAADDAAAGGMAVACQALRAAMHGGSPNGDGLGTHNAMQDVFHTVLGVRFMRMLVAEFLCAVWNDVVSARVKRFGCRIILEGDLVMPKTAVPSAQDQQASVSSASMAGGPVQPIFATQADIASGLYTYCDVLLPLAGHGVLLPAHHGMRATMADILSGSYGIQLNPETLAWDVFNTADAVAAADSSSGMEVDDEDTPASDAALLADPKTDPQQHQQTFVSATAGGTGGIGLAETSTQRTSNSIAALQRAPHEAAAGVSPLGGDALQPSWRRGSALGVVIHGSYRKLYGDASSLTVVGMTAEEEDTGTATHPTTGGSGTGNTTAAAKPHTTAGGGDGGGGKQRATPASAALANVTLTFSLPSASYSSMLLRELTKYDVNSGSVLPSLFEGNEAGDGEGEERKAASWKQLSPSDKAAYQQLLSKRRKVRRVAGPPEAMALAQLHQQMFVSGGMRKSLLPSARGYDDVVK